MKPARFLKPLGVPQASQILLLFLSSPRRPHGAPIVFRYDFTAAKGGGFQNGRRRWHRKRRKGGAEGATPPEGERNCTESGCFTSLYTNTVVDDCVTLSVSDSVRSL